MAIQTLRSLFVADVQVCRDAESLAARVCKLQREITAKGSKFTVTLNGKKTVDGVADTKLKPSNGRIGRPGNKDAAGVVNDKGVVKFRKVEIRPL